MQKGIHPECQEVTLILSNGTQLVVEMTKGKGGTTLKLDVDPYNHPVWKKDKSTFINVHNSEVSRFKNKYGDIFS
jgi:ribosomal protein L31